jgi:hypothetical protein
MSETDELLQWYLMKLPRKPDDKAKQAEKKAYSEQMSAAAALALAEALRRKGLSGTYPLAKKGIDIENRIADVIESGADAKTDEGRETEETK